jgi:hypothetical protein
MYPYFSALFHVDKDVVMDHRPIQEVLQNVNTNLCTVNGRRGWTEERICDVSLDDYLFVQ